VLPEVVGRSGSLSLVSERVGGQAHSSPPLLARHISKEIQQRVDLLRCRLSVLESESSENNQTLASVQARTPDSQMLLLSTYCRDLAMCTRLLYNLSTRIANCDHKLIHLSVNMTEAKDDFKQLVLDREVERTKEQREQLVEQLEEAKLLKKFTNRRGDKLSVLLKPHLAEMYCDKFADFSVKLVDIVLGEEEIREKIKGFERQKRALDTMFNNISVSVL